MRIGIITSGGDAPGMNATIRAITRCALDRGIEVVGIYEGWQGVVDGGDKFEPFNWRSVGGILQLGGTIIGTARSDAFRTLEGRRQAARNLVNMDWVNERPKEEAFLQWRGLADTLAKPGPTGANGK